MGGKRKLKTNNPGKGSDPLVLAGLEFNSQKQGIVVLRILLIVLVDLLLL